MVMKTKKWGVWMLEHISSVKIINAGHRISVYKEHVKNRKYHAIFYKDQGVTRYEFDGQTHILNTDCAIYLPKGGTYYYENIGELEGKIFDIIIIGDNMIEHGLTTTSNEINSIKNQMQWTGSAQTNINEQFDTCLKQLDNEISRIDSFNRALELLDEMLEIDKSAAKFADLKRGECAEKRDGFWVLRKKA